MMVVDKTRLEQAKEVIKNTIKELGGTASFVNLEDALEDANLVEDTEEEEDAFYTISGRAGKNCVIWSTTNALLIHSYLELEHMAEIYIHPCIEYANGIPLIYLLDGEILNLPIPRGEKARNLGNLKEPHWLPGVVSDRPFNERQRKFGIEKRKRWVNGRMGIER